MNKELKAQEAILRIEDGYRVMIGGFGLRGCPDELLDKLVLSNKQKLTIISNDLGGPNQGLGRLMANHQISGLIGSYYNWNPDAIAAYNAGEISVTLVPQGTLAESMRAAGMGIPAYYTPASADTDLEKGKEAREFDGKRYVLEKAIYADVALIRANKADTMGNLVYSKTARNFNPLMAMAATYTIAEVDEIVEVGQLDPEDIVSPHIFVDAIVKRGNK